MTKPFLDVLHGKDPDRMPIWLMRQAGRYLPEYRELRKQAGSFLDLCLTPDLAAEITLQPIRRFGFDAAILFADILLIPHALGQKLEFREGEGPHLDPLADDEAIRHLSFDAEKLAPVFETVANLRGRLPERTALIGFCGGIWTVAGYMIDGNSRTEFATAKSWLAENPERFGMLADRLIDASEDYLCRQIEAGAEAIQIFESWAGLLAGGDFDRWVIEPTRELVARIKSRHPAIPVIGFPRGAGSRYRDYAAKTGIDGMGIDQHADMDTAKREWQPLKPLQGNLDPQVLVKGGAEMKQAARKIMDLFGPRHIFNLGHGVVPQTPPEHVKDLVEYVRGYASR